MKKLPFCICENKDADQLRGNREADQRLCFRYLDNTIPLLPKSIISSFYPSPVVNCGLCGRTFGVYQSSHLIGIQFLIGYGVDSLIIDRL